MALVLVVGPLAAGCGARSALLDGAGGAGGAAPVDAGPDSPAVIDAGPDAPVIVDAGPGCPVPEQPCYSGLPGTEGIGVCHGGTQVYANGVFGPCVGESLPSPEVCDGLDNDCNGAADEGTCGGGTVCASSIQTDFSTLPSKWLFNGSASWIPSGPWAQLTPAVGMAAGTMIYENPIFTDAFTAKFVFTIGGGDGLAFMIETAGPKGVGSNGGGMGVAGLGGYAVELDTYDDGQACGDSGGNHVGLDDLKGTCGMGLPVALGSASAPFNLGDQKAHGAFITFDSGKVSVSIDGAPAGAFDIPGWAAGKSYYYGFGAGTGDAVGRQIVESVVIAFPTYRCL